MEEVTEAAWRNSINLFGLNELEALASASS